ncbi:MAG: hypothetical protein LBU11_02755 [Zoogloeaceae bacterium]|jgi:hypothetical protein|nr:hypothetical protein [Zoogloeaceae bacterium]
MDKQNGQHKEATPEKPRIITAAFQNAQQLKNTGRDYKAEETLVIAMAAGPCNLRLAFGGAGSEHTAPPSIFNCAQKHDS